MKYFAWFALPQSGLERRIFLLVQGSVFVASLLLGGLILGLTLDAFRDYLNEKNERILNNLAEALVVPVIQKNYSMVVDIIDGVAASGDLKCVGVMDPEGTIMVSTDSSQTRLRLPANTSAQHGYSEKKLEGLGKIAIWGNDAILWEGGFDMLLALGISLVVVMPLAGLVTRRICRSLADPIQRITGVAQTVAEGDLASAEKAIAAMPQAKMSLDPAKPAQPLDETCQLLEAIMTMTASLSSLLGRVQRSEGQLTLAASRIASASKQQEASVQAFGGSTAQITASVNQISATSQQLQNTMNSVSEVANTTAKQATDGRALLETRQKTMGQLLQATGSISGKLSVINQRAGDINLVVTTINKVADQTNLLSINASIEAEKAGEAGLGFQIVAREIRRLSDQTAEATQDIEQIVRDMQASVSSGVKEMDKFSQEVRHEAQEVGQITDQLGGIIQQVQALTTRFNEVNEGMRSQSVGAEQIKNAMLHLNDAARQTAESLHEFTLANENLNQAVGGLKEEVSRFKISAGT